MKFRTVAYREGNDWYHPDCAPPHWRREDTRPKGEVAIVISPDMRILEFEPVLRELRCCMCNETILRGDPNP